MAINHFALNLVTKGLLNISNMTKGILTISYELIRRKGGGVAYRTEYEEDLFRKIKQYEDVDAIKVYVDWKKNYKGNKLVEAKLIKEYIKTEILKETEKTVKVEIIYDKEE